LDACASAPVDFAPARVESEPGGGSPIRPDDDSRSERKRAGRLRKHWRRLTDIAEVDGTDIAALWQLWSGGKLNPFHLPALRRQALFHRPWALSRVSRLADF
jgi:hypothetical protein